MKRNDRKFYLSESRRYKECVELAYAGAITATARLATTAPSQLQAVEITVTF